ncbi:MAG: hypothetical protein LUG65_01210, partial [Clostridiales bacterium]|nr:hypothetical protein [Clostridiales bacterium]
NFRLFFPLCLPSACKKGTLQLFILQRSLFALSHSGGNSGVFDKAPNPCQIIPGFPLYRHESSALLHQDSRKCRSNNPNGAAA